MAQSSFAANNQSDGDNSFGGAPVVVKTRLGRFVMPPVGTLNITKGTNRSCNDWSTASEWLGWFMMRILQDKNVLLTYAIAH